MTVDALEKKIQKEVSNGIYLFYGEEIYLLELIVKKIKKNFGELVPGINLVTIDETNIQNIIPEIETPAFGYDKKLIIVKNTGLFKKEGKRKNAVISEEKEKLTKYIPEHIKQIEECIVLIFIEESADKFKLYKLVDEYGTVCQFEKQKLPGLIARLKGICNAYKVNADDATLKYLIENCGTGLQELINEIRKLIEYAGQNGTITKKEIDLLSIKQIESVIFDLTDNLGKRDVTSALEVLNNLLYNKEPIQKILITLYHHFKKLYIVKLSEKYQRNLVEALNLKPNQMFLVTKYKQQANYFTEEELRDILFRLIELDANYKVGLIDLNLGLESILCRYCSK